MTAAKIGSFDHVTAAKFADKPAWEEVTWWTERLEVPGGWIYRTGVRDWASLVFVPNPDLRASDTDNHKPTP